ncbi:MAG TPA: SxtJ family membrane protein [Vicinamibacterales bacterium]|nr:hypothetical protein [Acidobacteriota bacterium]HOC16662.1 SxtJ family membrane protein [Vicinamibacterales bacterium]
MNFRDLNLRPNDRELRQFSALWLVGFGLLGAIVAWRAGAFASGIPPGWHAPWRLPIALWGIAAMGAAVGLAVPRAIRPVYVAWMVAAFPIGWAVSQLLLALVYYVLFTAFGLVFRIAGRDALGRSFDRGASSYWVARKPASSLERYFRQF